MTSTPSTRRQLDGVALWYIMHPTHWLICAQVLRLDRWVEPDCRLVLLRAHVGLRLLGRLIICSDRTGSTSLNDPSADDRWGRQ